jgi:hypothetical protein
MAQRTSAVRALTESYRLFSIRSGRCVHLFYVAAILGFSWQLPRAALDRLYFVFSRLRFQVPAQIEKKKMFLAGKAAYAGIVFLLLTTWISGPRPAALTVAADLSKEVPGGSHSNNINKMQQILLNKGHYRGRSMACSVCEREPAFARIRRLRIDQSQGSLMARPRGSLESHQKLTRRLATRLRTVNLRQAASALRTPGGHTRQDRPQSRWILIESERREREKKLPVENE